MLKPITFAVATAGSLATLVSGAIAADAKPALMADNITVKEVKAAQNGWCDALPAISKAHKDGGISKPSP